MARQARNRRLRKNGLGQLASGRPDITEPFEFVVREPYLLHAAYGAGPDPSCGP
jgi:hypothetical protein